jgi:hypothetical protein
MPEEWDSPDKNDTFWRGEPVIPCVIQSVCQAIVHPGRNSLTPSHEGSLKTGAETSGGLLSVSWTKLKPPLPRYLARSSRINTRVNSFMLNTARDN